MVWYFDFPGGEFQLVLLLLLLSMEYAQVWHKLALRWNRLLRLQWKQAPLTTVELLPSKHASEYAGSRNVSNSLLNFRVSNYLVLFASGIETLGILPCYICPFPNLYYRVICKCNFSPAFIHFMFLPPLFISDPYVCIDKTPQKHADSRIKIILVWCFTNTQEDKRAWVKHAEQKNLDTIPSSLPLVWCFSSMWREGGNEICTKSHMLHLGH